MSEAANAGLRPRRLPQRTCVACGSVTSKRELVRIVRGADGGVEADPTGKKPGRGAYLHADSACWELGLRKKKLEKSLKTAISADHMAALSGYAERFAAEATV